MNRVIFPRACRMNDRAFFPQLLLFVAITRMVTASAPSCRLRTREDSGELICSFLDNIEKSKYNFAVQRYGLKPNDTAEETVLLCTWLASGLGCTVNAGYSFDNYVSDLIIVDMPKLSKDHEGRYTCQLVGKSADTVKYCTYEYTGGGPATTPETPTSTTWPQRPDSDKAEQDGCWTSMAILGILTGSFGTLAVALVTRFFIHWRQGRKGTPETDIGIAYTRSEPLLLGHSEETTAAHNTEMDKVALKLVDLIITSADYIVRNRFESSGYWSSQEGKEGKGRNPRSDFKEHSNIRFRDNVGDSDNQACSDVSFPSRSDDGQPNPE